MFINGIVKKTNVFQKFSKKNFKKSIDKLKKVWYNKYVR